jgi:hypothetical protein
MRINPDPAPCARPTPSFEQAILAQATDAASVTSPASELLEGAADEAQDLLDRVARAMVPPQGQPCALEVCETSIRGLEQVLRQLRSPAAEIEGWLAALRIARDQMQRRQGDKLISSHAALDGKRSKHPIWVTYALFGADGRSDCASLLMLGCAEVLAFGDSKKEKRPISSSLPKKLASLAALGPYNEQQLSLILSAQLSESEELNEGILYLRRLWTKVLAKYGSGQTPPPATPNERIRAQVLSAALNTSAGHVAGALDDRMLSHDQYDKWCGLLRTALASQTLIGALGVLVMRTGLAVDVAATLPLGMDPAPDGYSCLDVSKGIAIIDLGVLANEASQPLPGAQPARHQLRIHLPLQLQACLATRRQENLDAKVLADLFPGHKTPDTRQRLYPGHDEIEPTWARLRYSLGVMLRYEGMNKLLAALLSGDFSIVPRAKFHYAMVSTHEFHALEQGVHARLGWGDTVNPPIQYSLGIGCTVVPEREHVRQHDQLLLQAAMALHPAKSTNSSSLHRFHNAYTRLVAWRLSVLLALRETTAIDLNAGIDCAIDRWTPIHDKSTRLDRGYQPVPLCDYLTTTIRLYKEHCSALASRLHHTSPEDTALSLRCSAVARSQNTRLLLLATREQTTEPVASSAFTTYNAPARSSQSHNASPYTYALAPDVGRKVMENELRLHGARSSDIDAFLRHFTLGQEPASAFDATVLNDSVRRVRRIQQKVADSLLGPPAVGLSKGQVRRKSIDLAHR